MKKHVDTLIWFDSCVWTNHILQFSVEWGLMKLVNRCQNHAVVMCNWLCYLWHVNFFSHAFMFDSWWHMACEIWLLLEIMKIVCTNILTLWSKLCQQNVSYPHSTVKVQNIKENIITTQRYYHCGLQFSFLASSLKHIQNSKYPSGVHGSLSSVVNCRKLSSHFL